MRVCVIVRVSVLVILRVPAGLGARTSGALLISDPPALPILIRVHAGRRLPVGALLDVAANGHEEPLRDSRNLRDGGLERVRVPL